MSRWALLCATFLFLAAAVPGHASQLSSEYLDAKLVSEHAVVSPGQTISIAVHQKMAPGWHTYWRNPGDSGQAPAIDWNIPEGVTVGAAQWSAPHRIEYGPLVNFGYSDETALLFDVMVPQDWPIDQPLPIRAEAEILVCEDICIPVSGHLALDLKVGPATKINTSAVDLFVAARNEQPIRSPWPVTLSTNSNQLTLTLFGPASDFSTIDGAFVFPETWGVVEHAAPQRMSITEQGLTLTASLGDVVPQSEFSGVFTLFQENGPSQSFALLAVPLASEPVAGSNRGDEVVVKSVLILAALAFAGGLLLNLMPCVFPVLAVKAVGLSKQADEPARVRIGHGIAYTLGVVLSFLALAGLLLALRAGGAAIGWGFQLQEPIIVGFLAYILMAVGLNLSGVFEVGGRLSQLGGSMTLGSGNLGSFAMGVLATLVAAPCTAPFMATAIGGALVLPAPSTLAVFAALGLGLAFPYLALTSMPALARWMPKSGPWMIKFKQLLAFPMYISVAWLIWVLSQQAGVDAAFIATLGLIALAFTAWAWPRDLPSVGSLTGFFRVTAVVVPLIGAFGALYWVSKTETTAARTASVESVAETFNGERLEELVNAGHPVLVNMTAAWCITCKVNERVALSGQRFNNTLANRGITYMQGDWTNRDDKITQFLERFGRLGVPLYVFYPGEGQAPTVLPQVLTPDSVDAVLSASTRNQT